MRPFLQAAGFPPSKTTFIPLAAMEGINLVNRDCPELQEWYDGPTLVELLGASWDRGIGALADSTLMEYRQGRCTRTTTRGTPPLPCRQRLQRSNGSRFWSWRVWSIM